MAQLHSRAGHLPWLGPGRRVGQIFAVLSGFPVHIPRPVAAGISIRLFRDILPCGDTRPSSTKRLESVEQKIDGGDDAVMLMLETTRRGL